jgi:O-antigen ligase
MTDFSYAQSLMRPSHGAYVAAMPRVAALQYALLWLIGAGGSVVLIEPSPYEFACLAAMVIFISTGLRMRASFLPLIALLFVVNIGYSICAAYLMDNTKIINWILTSWYMAVTAIFFAMVFSEDTEKRLHALRNGLIVGAVITSLLGIGGYFKIIPGGEVFTLYGRASGGFKDPNVLGAFLVLPGLLCLQAVLEGGLRKVIWYGAILGLIALAVLLSFSRAAWGQLAGTGVIVMALMFATSRSNKQRVQIIGIAIIAVAAIALLVAILLSMDSVANLFKERASFGQSYDGGRFGRFGRHILGAEMALDLPFGIGPLQFTRFFPEDTHNSYLNAFMSGGWISGITYPALVLGTIWLGFRYIFVRVPWQRAYIVIYVAFAGTVAESFIIDTDHWRHFFLMLGAVWGMMVAARVFARERDDHKSTPA